MNTVANKPVSIEEKNGVEVEGTPSLPSKREILDTLYAHYSRPQSVVVEKVNLYFGYETSAGHKQEDWIEDGWQMGRVTIFSEYKENQSDMYHKTRIEPEGKGSWFIGVRGKEIKVYLSGKLDVTLKVGK